MNNTHTPIYFTLGAALAFIFLVNGMYFAMPYAHLNPYEFFQNRELNHFQVLNLFTGGIGIPLLAVSAAGLMYALKDKGTRSIILTLILVMVVGIVQSILIFGYDVLPVLTLSLIIGALFLKVNRWITLIAFIILMMVHMVLNGFLELMIISGLDDQIYTNIQDVNEFSSVYRSSDYLAIVGTNLEVFIETSVTGVYESTMNILPYVLLGIVFGQFSVMKYIKKNTGMMIFLAMVISGGGITVKLLQVVSLGSGSIFTVSEVIGGGLLSVSVYLILLMIGMHLPKKIAEVFMRTGKKVLTAYILFNILMMFLFYGIGFSLYGEVPVAELTFYVFIGYIIIVLITNILEYFNVKSLEDIVIIDRRK